MCQICGSQSCSGQCQNGWPFNRPFYNPSFTTPFNRQCRPPVPNVPASPCPSCQPCNQNGCLASITTDCVLTQVPYPCLQLSQGSTLTAVLAAMNTLLCATPSVSSCQVKVNTEDACCGDLASKITSSSLTITTLVDGAGCVTLNIEAPSTPVTTRPTIYLNSNQNGTDNYSIALPSPPLVTGDTVVDFDGRVRYSHATASPTFDFNVKGNRVVFSDNAPFAKYPFDTSGTLGVYTITPPKKYLGNNLNGLQGEELVYESVILVNCNSTQIPDPVANYDTSVDFYLGVTMLSQIADMGISSPKLLRIRLVIRRTSNTVATFTHDIDFLTASAGMGGIGFVSVSFPQASITTYGTLPLATDLDTDPLVHKMIVHNLVSTTSGLEFQVVSSKITLNKF